jgi:peroxiredoxin-like protein
MQSYPHHYEVLAGAETGGSVTLSAEGLPALSTAAPAQYGGPGDQWAPETLFVAAVADCFILTFRAVAEASKFNWRGIECRAEGTVDRAEGAVQFTEIRLHVRLSVPADTDTARAERLLDKAKRACLVTSSLKREPTLTMDISSDDRDAPAIRAT